MINKFNVHDSRVLLIEGDITQISVDAMVSAANSQLAGGGGVDGAIHRAGGPSIMNELDQIRSQVGFCAPGKAVLTSAGNLPAKYVIHTVGPVFRDGLQGEPRKLSSCYLTALDLAEKKGVQSISFPSISTGTYGYPMAEAADLAVQVVVEYLRRSGCLIKTVNFVLFGHSAYQTHLEAAWRHLESADLAEDLVTSVDFS